MLRKIFTVGIAALAIALVTAAFVAGIALGLAFILATPTSASTTEPQPQPENQNDDLLDVDVWLDPTPTTSPRWSSFGLIHEIKDIPLLTPVIAPKLLPPAVDTIAQTTTPPTPATLGEVLDPWIDETPYALPPIASVLVLPQNQPLLLSPANETPTAKAKKSKAPKVKPTSATENLTKMSREALKQRCRTLKIPRYSSLNKAQMIAAIAAATA